MANVRVLWQYFSAAVILSFPGLLVTHFSNARMVQNDQHIFSNVVMVYDRHVYVDVL